MKETTNTLSAGQDNSEVGGETSWLAPEQPSETSPCGPCITHKADSGHVTWSGTHKVQLAEMVGRASEVGETRRFTSCKAHTYCATANCQCRLPKLADAVTDVVERDGYALAG